jgi:hypothetical protein
MSVTNITSRRSEREAVKLAEDIAKLCVGHDMTIVACALMGAVASLPQHLAAQVCMTVAAQVTEKTPGLKTHGNNDPQDV